MSCGGGGQGIASLYGGNSFIGRTVTLGTADTTTAVRIRLRPTPTDGSPFDQGVFSIEFLAATSAICMRQGGDTVVATADDFKIPAASATTTVWRVDVNDPSQAYLSILTPDAAVAAGNIRITRIDRVDLTASAALGTSGGSY